jgi:uncharacterized protein (TIGR02271 family)
MAETNQTYSTVVGYFSSHEQADRAIRALVDAGFNRTQIGIAGRSVGSFTTEDDRKRAEPHVSFWQRVKNFFEGQDSYEDTLRRTDARQDFGSEDYYDYESGDFHQSLGGLSLPAEKSRYFNDRFERDPNGVLLTVEAGTRRAEAEAILEQNGADIGRTSSTWSYDQTRDTTASGRAEPQRIQLYGEVLRVHRDRIQRGEARLRKETVTENQRVDVPVTREELVVEKVPVTGEKAAPGARIGEDSEVRVPLSEERVSVEKEPVVREEVRVGKKGVTNVESRDETLRREELHVEDKSKKAS